MKPDLSVESEQDWLNRLRERALAEPDEVLVDAEGRRVTVKEIQEQYRKQRSG